MVPHPLVSISETAGEVMRVDGSANPAHATIGLTILPKNPLPCTQARSLQHEHKRGGSGKHGKKRTLRAARRRAPNHTETDAGASPQTLLGM